MENILKFLSEYSNLLYFILGVVLTVIVWLLVPAKKPHPVGDLFVIHYQNGFKELYLRLEDEIDTFENDPKVCFNVLIDDRTE